MTNATHPETFQPSQLTVEHPDADKQAELEYAFSLMPVPLEKTLKYKKFDGFSFAGNQSELPSAKDGKHVTFIYRLMLGSRSENLHEALAEWEMGSDRQVVMTADDLAYVKGPNGEPHPELKTKGSEVGPGNATKCLCGHDIYNVCEVYNPQTQNRLRIGNCCITKFLPPEVARQFNAAARARDNAKDIKEGKGKLFSDLTFNSLLGHYAAPKLAQEKYATASRAKKAFPVTELDRLTLGCLTYHFVDRLLGWAPEDFEAAFRAGRIDSAQRDLLNEAMAQGLDICTPADRVYKNRSWAYAVTDLVESSGFKHFVGGKLQIQADANNPDKVIIRREATSNPMWHKAYVTVKNSATGKITEMPIEVYKTSGNPKGLLVAQIIGGDTFEPGHWAIPVSAFDRFTVAGKGLVRDSSWSNFGIAAEKPDAEPGTPGDFSEAATLEYDAWDFKLNHLDND